MSGNRGLDKRKAMLFVVLVAVALLCVIVWIYTLFYAKPRTTPHLEKHGRSMLRHAAPLPQATCPTVHS